MTGIYVAEEELADNEAGYCRKYKFAFQWCEGQGNPWWWLNSDQESISQQEDRSGKKCLSCSKTSFQVYLPAWVCLNAQCGEFWRIDDKPYHDEKTGNPLPFCPSFLSLRDDKGDKKLDLSTELPAMEVSKNITASKHFLKGWWCKECGMLSSR